jgi:hypothetical protein
MHAMTRAFDVHVARKSQRGMGQYAARKTTGRIDRTGDTPMTGRVVLCCATSESWRYMPSGVNSL